jgi:hypothetical protein
MSRSFAQQTNAQVVLDLYGGSERSSIVQALNEDRRRHAPARGAARWLRSRLHR